MNTLYILAKGKYRRRHTFQDMSANKTGKDNFVTKKLYYSKVYVFRQNITLTETLVICAGFTDIKSYIDVTSHL